MKKIIYVILIIVMILVISKPRYDLSGDMVRFRVIPNSNSSKDILIKEKVVNELSTLLFKDANDINETRNNVVNNLDKINNSIDKVFSENNYNLKYKVKYGMNYFPSKEYNDIRFEAGNYESLVVEIGEAKGNNYWCILYPPLCMVDYEKDTKIEYKSKIMEILSNLF